jgi:hypothetical protein
MRAAIIILLIVCVTPLVGCSKRKFTANRPTIDLALSCRPTSIAQKLSANDFSRDGYRNGIFVADGKQQSFYFVTTNPKGSAVAVGDQVRFAQSGSASVTKVDTAIQGSSIAVFVTVDKKLDPSGDGFPNPILVLTR